MKKRSLLFLAGLVLIIGCRQDPFPGVELGNPSKGGTTVKVVPDKGDQFYQLTFLEGHEALVEKYVAAPEESLVDSVVVPYQETGESWSLQATFSDGTTVTLEGTVNEQRTVTSVTVRVDSREVASCFETRETGTRCRTASATLTDRTKTSADRPTTTTDRPATTSDRPMDPPDR